MARLRALKPLFIFIIIISCSYYRISDSTVLYIEEGSENTEQLMQNHEETHHHKTNNSTHETDINVDTRLK